MSGRSWFSRGKLLLTGEYLVMEGAEALAIPLKHGQSLSVEETAGSDLEWVALEMGDPWFTARFTLPGIDILSERNDISLRLQRLLRAAGEMNPEVLKTGTGVRVTTDTSFRLDWGFGSSSTLVSDLAYWFAVDPFELLSREFSGSGYDIACARSDKPVFYRLFDGQPFFRTVDFNPPFSNDIYFVHLGRKQVTEESVLNFRKSSHFRQEDIDRISTLTVEIARSGRLKEFERLMDEHEQIMSSILGIDPVKQRLFPDFGGSIKSLGSWGGDFVMATSGDGSKRLYEYFRSKGLTTIFKFAEVIP